MNQRTLVGIVALLALIVGVIGALFVAPPDSSSTSSGSPVDDTEYFSYYPAPRELSEFSLRTHRNKVLENDSLKGQWTLAFLGYTFCPDICPTTMAELNRIYSSLQELKSEQPIRVLFISVDPNRDSIERLAEYVGFFNDQFIAATGGHSELFPLARSMGMMYAIAESTDKPNYLVDHSASVVVINPNAQVIGRFKPVLAPGKLAVAEGEHILADMPRIISQAE